jgi:hypothetical protein
MFDTWINVLTDEVWTYEWMNFTSCCKSMCQMCFQCMILVCEMFKLWMNKFCMISIIKSWDAKFVMNR